jgi:membrane-associated phospholipid phosphatase
MSMLLGIEFGTPDGSGLAQPLDESVARWTGRFRPSGLVRLARIIDAVGSIWPMIVVGGIVGGFCWRGSRRPGTFFAPLVAIGASQAVALVSRSFVARPRPEAIYAAASQSGFAWPSSHAATATALAACTSILMRSSSITAHRKLRGRIVLVVAAVAAAITPIVLGVQWTSDVLMGVGVGTLIALVATRRLLGLDRRTLRRPMRHATRRVIAALSTTATLLCGASYTKALTAPGGATVGVRTIEWLRDHHFSGSVDRAETWYLWRNMPSTTATLTSLPGPPLETTIPIKNLVMPAPMTPALSPTLPGEGIWIAALASPTGQLAVATTRLRPDSRHPGVVVSLAWINRSTTRFELIRGTRQPGGGPGPSGASVPLVDRALLLAVFNSGYKMADTPGGALEEGRLARPLKSGLATLGIHADGSATVMEWGRDPTGDRSLVAARQNLKLIVDHGHLVDGLRLNVGGRWGRLKHALPTWRSGIGVDPRGNTIYASGQGLTLDTLADALRRAGAVTAMELDIHPNMVTFSLFSHTTPRTPIGHKLSPDMPGNADRYLTTDQRDFVAVLSR